jgi:hypothetical protein
MKWTRQVAGVWEVMEESLRTIIWFKSFEEGDIFRSNFRYTDSNKCTLQNWTFRNIAENKMNWVMAGWLGTILYRCHIQAFSEKHGLSYPMESCGIFLGGKRSESESDQQRPYKCKAESAYSLASTPAGIFVASWFKTQEQICAHQNFKSVNLNM